MKKTVITFIVSALVLAGLAAWLLKGRVAGNAGEIVMAGIVLLLVGFAVYVGVSRLRSHARREPAEDELSKKVMIRASSFAFYVSLYLWLFVMYISDKTSLEAHTLVGAGIVGMAVVFVACWLGVRVFGLKHD